MPHTNHQEQSGVSQWTCPHSFIQWIYLLPPGQITSVLFQKKSLPPKQKIHYHPWYVKKAALQRPDHRSDPLSKSSITEQDQWNPHQSMSWAACNWETHATYCSPHLKFNSQTKAAKLCHFLNFKRHMALLTSDGHLRTNLSHEMSLSMTLKTLRGRWCVAKFDECFRFHSSSERFKTAAYNFSDLLWYIYTMKMWYIYTMEYYSAIKRNEIGSFVEIWMDLESVIQSEVSQKEKNKYRILMRYVWNLEK